LRRRCCLFSCTAAATAAQWLVLHGAPHGRYCPRKR
jgi:hypothetical protein